MLSPVRRFRAHGPTASFPRRARVRPAKPVREDDPAVFRIRMWIAVLDEWGLELPGSRTELLLEIAAAEAGVSIAAMRACMHLILSRWSELGFAPRDRREDVHFAVESRVRSGHTA